MATLLQCRDMADLIMADVPTNVRSRVTVAITIVRMVWERHTGEYSCENGDESAYVTEGQVQDYACQLMRYLEGDTDCRPTWPHFPDTWDARKYSGATWHRAYTVASWAVAHEDAGIASRAGGK